jgi:hypothetical protein
MDSEMKLLVEEYYKVFGITPSKRRITRQVQARAAMMSALRQYSTTTAIGELFSMDHSSVVHHTRKHEANMSMWAGYKEFFFVAQKMCRQVFKNKTIQGKIKSVQLEIRRLKSIEKRLTENLNS